MTQDTTWRRMARFSLWPIGLILASLLIGAASVAISGWMIDRVERTEGGEGTALRRASIADYFGGVNAVFSGLALLLLVVTLLLQQRELRHQRQQLALQRQELASSRDELRRSAEADLRGLHVELTQMAMADPALAEVWNNYPGEPTVTLRQNLFANLAFNHIVLFHSWGNVSEEELLLYASDLLQSPVFRRYWGASRASKSSLPPESTEGRVFRVFERAYADLDRTTPPPTPGSGP